MGPALPGPRAVFCREGRSPISTTNPKESCCPFDAPPAACPPPLSLLLLILLFQFLCFFMVQILRLLSSCKNRACCHYAMRCLDTRHPLSKAKLKSWPQNSQGHRGLVCGFTCEAGSGVWLNVLKYESDHSWITVPSSTLSTRESTCSVLFLQAALLSERGRVTEQTCCPLHVGLRPL